MKDEKSENVSVDYLSSLSLAEGEALIGKTVARVDGGEYLLKITFTDGSVIECSGHTYGGCSLSVDVESPDIVKPAPPKSRDERQKEQFEQTMEAYRFAQLLPGNGKI